MKNVILLLMFLLSACAHGVPSAQPAYLEGLNRPEDLAPITGTPWVLVASMRSPDGTSGTLTAIDVSTKTSAQLFPSSFSIPDFDPQTFRACPGAPSAGDFNPHGITFSSDANDRGRLLVVNHGGREAVEIFDVEMKDKKPVLIWRGCAVMPPKTWPNGVATLGRNEFVVTSMYDPDTDFQERFDRTEPTGRVWKWSPDAEWSPAVEFEFSAANGIETSADGRWLFVSEWAAKKVHRFSLDGKGEHSVVDVDFLPDNLHRTQDNQILLAGQKAKPSSLFTCEPGRAPACPQGYAVVEIDTDSLRTHRLVDGGSDLFGGGTAAVRVRAGSVDELWVGTVLNNRVARFSW